MPKILLIINLFKMQVIDLQSHHQTIFYYLFFLVHSILMTIFIEHYLSVIGQFIFIILLYDHLIITKHFLA